jgi:hypothetical protein
VDIAIQTFLRSCSQVVDIDDVSFEVLYLSSLLIHVIGFSFDIMLLDIMRPKTLTRSSPEPEMEPSDGGRCQDTGRKKRFSVCQ